MAYSEKFIPSLLIPEIYFAYQKQEGLVVEVVEKVLEEQFYGAIEIGLINHAEERKVIEELTSQVGIEITQWMTSIIDEKNLDLSAIHSSVRKSAVKELLDYFYVAAETGASNISIVSGPFAGEESIDDAKKGFYESLNQLCEEAQKYNMMLLFEPLDRFAHKKKFMGPTSDAVEVIRNVRKTYQNIGLAFDTAHAALNGEVIEDALLLAKAEVEQIHFSNAVLDKENNLYGDYHMPIGEPGFLSVERIAGILKRGKELELNGNNGLRIAIEVRNLGEECVHSLADRSKAQLQKAINLVRNEVKR